VFGATTRTQSFVGLICGGDQEKITKNLHNHQHTCSPRAGAIYIRFGHMAICPQRNQSWL